jgi:peptidoglycan/LPS O-acetylase OafA/YrhL
LDKGSAPDHIAALDGLRGFASVVVVARHAFNAIDFPLSDRQFLDRTPLAVLLNAQGAVQLFFVLSGYVLAASLQRNRRAADVLQFYVRRIFRIQPPYVLAVVFAWCVSLLYALPSGGASDWLRLYASVRVDPAVLPATFVIPGIAHGLLPVAWTLTIEMLFSLLLPLMLLIARVHCALLLAVSASLLALGGGRWQAWYAIDFALGIAAYLERDALGRAIARIPGAAGAAAVAVALALFAAPQILGWTSVFMGVLVPAARPSSIVLMGLGSVLLILAAVHLPWASRLLSSAPAVFLGKISFSLYLLHIPVLIVTFRLLEPSARAIDYALLFACVMVVAGALSVGFYTWVERPSIRFGNLLCSRLAARTATRPLPSTLIDS